MIVPARLAFAADGTPMSTAYGDIYHSADGGLAQARHVFIGGNDLPGRWRGRECFVVLETGFGIGLNFLATWQAWRDDARRCSRLHFVSVEKHPFSAGDLALLHTRWPELAALAGELRRHWPPLVPGFHRLHFDAEQVSLTLLFGEGSEQFRRLEARADAIYLDGFAPARNPELWSPQFLQTVTARAAPGATLATWSVAAALREGLAAAGWTLQLRSGFGRKRDMLMARRDAGEAHPAAPRRHAIIIGAGIAGAACAARLAVRGWQVDLIERHAGPAREASGNPAGVLLPLLAKDDNIAARLSRACYLYALHTLRRLTESGSPPLWRPCGVVQVARDAEHEALQRDAVARLGLAADFVSFREKAELAQVVGRAVALGGWHFPGGAWVSPPSLCRALIGSGGGRIASRFDAEASYIERSVDGWRVVDTSGATLAVAPHLILANAHAAARLVPQAELPLKRIRGQVSFLPGTVLPGLSVVVCRQGYVTPAAPVGGDGTALCCLGATFDAGDDDPLPRREDHESNLRRLEELLPGAGRELDAGRLDGRVGFRTATPHRLPMAGTLADANAATRREARLAELERIDGLHCLLGYGARGMVWSALAAELLAARLEGEPLPLETDLVAAADPARFRLRALRQGRR